MTAGALAALAAVGALAPVMQTMAAEWLPVKDQDLRIRPGSLLDFSRLVEPGPAGKHGRVIATPNGHMAFAKAPAKPKRFLCASQPYGVEEGFPDHETADAYARQLRMHGYNLARFHFVDNVLMNGRTKDFDFDPEQLDRFHYFLAALKREGIYWMLDVLTSWNGAYGDVGGDRWADKRDVKLGVYLNEEDREHWRELAEKLLVTENPYTGISPLQDPALVAVVTVNEGGLNNLLNRKSSEALNRQFTRWLGKRYGSVENATRKWGGAFDRIDAVALPHREWHVTPRTVDAQRFYFDAQSATQQWMTEFLREKDYHGFVSAFDNWFTVQDIATRAQLDLVTVHAYHDEASNFVSPGSTIMQASSLPDRLAYIRNLAVSRYWDKPFAVTEYDQPFWNRHRFESGLAMGAYAALQDWDAVCRHASGPIELDYGGKRGDRHQYLFPYAIGLDPVARAAETLAALLYLRRDIDASPHRVAVNLNAQYVFDQQGGIGYLPDDINQIGLLAGLGMQWEGGPHKVKSNLLITPDNPAPSRLGKLVQKVEHMLHSGADNRSQQRIDLLKKNRILAPANASDLKAGKLQSDTGQIVLDVRNGTLSAQSARTEAVAFDHALPAAGTRLKVESSSDPALLAASAMDGAALEASSRILVIFATDARNSGMEFSDTDEKVLKKLGTKPVLIKSSRILFSLKHKHPGKLHLYALKLNGERGAELPLKATADGIEVALDMAKLADGPTTYFELRR